MSEPVYIYDAVRTIRAKGKSSGALAHILPHDLVASLVEALRHRNDVGLDKHISRLILGCVTQFGPQGGHMALVSRLTSGLPHTVAAKTLNNYCASGLSAVMDGALHAAREIDSLVLAGGVESMSQVPFQADKAAFGLDRAVSEKSNYQPPIMGAEFVATREGFTKSNLDAVSLRSHKRAEAAWREGFYDSHVVLMGNAKQDEYIRGDLTLEKISSLPPAFAGLGASGFDAALMKAFPEYGAIEHVHSVANCPGLADGASLVLLGSRAAGLAAGLKPLARIVDFQDLCGDPLIQFDGGFKAMDVMLKRAGRSVHDFDTIECMESFAATILKFERDYSPDMDTVNPKGGHLAMGHPMGATGAMLVSSLAHQLIEDDLETGLVVINAATGIGAAMILERV